MANYQTPQGFSGYTPFDYSSIQWGPASGTAGGSAPAGGGGFNLSPSPTTGQGAYGAVPGQLGLPNPLGNLVGVLPQLPQINQGVSGAINSASQGQLSPDVLAQIRDNSANYGVSSGMPGSGLAANRGLRDIGRTSLDQQHWAAQAYPGFVGAVSGTQTVSPALQNEIATQNALNRAAPDPNKAASAAQKLFNDYLAKMGGSGGSKSPAGGYGGGSGGYGGYGGAGFSLPGFDPSAGTGQVPTAASGGYSGVRSGVQDSYPGAAPTWDTYNSAVNGFMGPLQNDPRAMPALPIAPAYDTYSPFSPDLFDPAAYGSGGSDPFGIDNLFDPNYGG